MPTLNETEDRLRRTLEAVARSVSDDDLPNHHDSAGVTQPGTQTALRPPQTRRRSPVWVFAASFLGVLAIGVVGVLAVGNGPGSENGDGTVPGSVAAAQPDASAGLPLFALDRSDLLLLEAYELQDETTGERVGTHQVYSMPTEGTGWEGPVLVVRIQDPEAYFEMFDQYAPYAKNIEEVVVGERHVNVYTLPDEATPTIPGGDTALLSWHEDDQLVYLLPWGLERSAALALINDFVPVDEPTWAEMETGRNDAAVALIPEGPAEEFLNPPQLSGDTWQLIVGEGPNPPQDSYKVCHRFAPAERANEANGFGPTGCVTWPDDDNGSIIRDVVEVETPTGETVLFIDLSEGVQSVSINVPGSEPIDVDPYTLSESDKQYAVVEMPDGATPTSVEAVGSTGSVIDKWEWDQ